MGNPISSRSSSLRILGALLIVGSFALGATIAGSILYVRHVFETTIVRGAAAAGIRLSLGQVSYGLGFIQLFDSRFELLQVPGVTGNVKRVDVDWSGLSPSKILVSGVAVTAKGDPVELYRSGSNYAERLQRLKFDSTPKSRPIDFEVRHLDVDATLSHPLLSKVALTELELHRKAGNSKDQTTLSTQSTRINTTDFGPLAVAFREKRGHVELGWGKSLEDADLTLTYAPELDGPTLEVTLKTLDTKLVFARFGLGTVPEAFAATKLSGTLSAKLSMLTGKLTGKLAFVLSGFVPPHPAELKGYAFKDETLLVATLESEPFFTTIELPVIQLSNGELKLRGTGRLERQELSTKLKADLSAQLDCIALAKGFAQDELGGALGQWGQRNANKTVRGSVEVRVQIDADSSRPADAKVVKRIGIGCGLRPLSFVDLLSLELPPPPDAKTAERLVKLLTKPGKLPMGPNLLPTFDEVLEINLKGIPPRSNKRP